MRLTKPDLHPIRISTKKEHQLSYNNTNVYKCNTLVANANQYNTIQHETDSSIFAVCCMCFGLHFGYKQYCIVLD